MVFRSYIVHLPVRKFSMRSEYRAECSKLKPTGIKLPPLFEVCCGRISIVTRFNSETSDIHCPERYSRHAEVYTARYLSLHIMPACSYVTTPVGSRITL